MPSTLTPLFPTFRRAWDEIRSWFMEPLELRLRQPPALPPLVFRPFQPEDAGRCLELYCLNEPGRFPADVRRVYEAELTSQSGSLLMVELAGQVVATCQLSFYLSRHYVCLSYGLVHPDFQCRGIGTAMLLMRLALAAKMSNGRNQQVHMVAVDASAPFYRKMGFWTLSVTRNSEGIGEHTLSLLLTPRLARRCTEVLAAARISLPEVNVPLRTVEEIQQMHALRSPTNRSSDPPASCK